MRFSTLIILSFFAFCFSLLAALESSDLTLGDVIARNTAAMGGAAAIEKVQTIKVSLRITDPGHSAIDGTYYAARPGRMRIDIMADEKRVYMERFDGEKAWQWQQGKGEQEEKATPTAALRHGVELPGNLFGLHEMQQRGHQLKLRGRETVDGVNYYVISLTLADGYETSLFVDPQSWRITRRRDVRALHPDIDSTPTTIESRKFDWRQVDGLWFAFVGEDIDLTTGKVIETTKVKEIKVNPPIDQAIFTKT